MLTATKTTLAQWLLAFSAAMLVSCASGPKYTQLDGQVRVLKEIAVIVDASITRGQTNADATFSVAENGAIAEKIAAGAAGVLATKGYKITPAPLRSVGINLLGMDKLRVLHDSAVTLDGPPPSTPPFLIQPNKPGLDPATVGALYRGARGDWISAKTNPFGETPVLVVSARGHYLSGGDKAINVAKGAANVGIVALVVVGAAFGGNPGNIDLISLDHSNLNLTFWLYDPKTGALLWKDELIKDGEPNAENLSGNLNELLKKLPEQRR